MPHGTSTATVSIHVHNLSQLFNSLDPSPFWDRDLDGEAAQFIEDEFAEKRSAQMWHLHVHAGGGVELAADLQGAVEHYYERMASSARRRLREEMHLGQIALLGGLAIFLVSMSARAILGSLFDGAVPRMLDEGLIILSWLALWRPAESLVYGWVPLYRKRRLYERLAAIRIFVRADPAQPRPLRGAQAFSSMQSYHELDPVSRAAPASRLGNVATETRRANMIVFQFISHGC